MHNNKKYLTKGREMVRIYFRCNKATQLLIFIYPHGAAPQSKLCEQLTEQKKSKEKKIYDSRTI
jgi:hypothetical protein